MAMDPAKQQKATSFLQGILSFVPDAQRAQAVELFQSLGNVELAAEHIASHILRQDDYSRVMNEGQEHLRTKQADLDALVESLSRERTDVGAWWDANKTALEDYKRIKGSSDGNGNSNTLPPRDDDPLTKPMSRKDVEDLINRVSTQAVTVMETYNALSLEHYKTFGDALTKADFERIRAHPQIGEIGLVSAWRATYKDKFDAVATAARDADVKKWKDEGRKEAMDEFTRQSGPPYVVPGQAPSVLDILEQPADAQAAAAKAANPEALAQAYMQKVAETSPDDAGWFNG